MRISAQSRTVNGLIMDMVQEIVLRRNLKKHEEKRLLAAATRAYYEERVPLNELQDWLLLVATTGQFSVSGDQAMNQLEGES